MSSPVIIQNPILNSPFHEPARHFRFDDDGITNDIIAERRESEYFIPIAKAKKKSGQLDLGTEWTQDRIEKNHEVNRIRGRVAIWRKGGYVGVTPTTRRLLEYWNNPERERKLFFCQVEALETAIYITEVAARYGDAWIEQFLVDANNKSNPGLPRVALKMATGAGKTVVMAMLIAWQTLNKLATPSDRRFTDTFLVVAPGITIRDRLRVLQPSEPDNYYRQRDLVPGGQMAELLRANILITNFHAFQHREKIRTGKLNKQILGEESIKNFTESDDEMVRRVCRELGSKKNIIVLNDEAHHCYRRKPDAVEEKLGADEKAEAKQRDEEARIWIRGIEAVKNKIGVKTIYDLSATPFFLRGSGYPEGTLFPWVVSDFSLIDAIESGIVKVPRVPVSDNSMTGEQPTFRDLWIRIRDNLPKKGRKTDKLAEQPNLPAELEAALETLYSNYRTSYEAWERIEKERQGGTTPPVFIVVCNNTNVSKMVYNWVSGWEKDFDGQTRVQAGKLDLFRNDDGNGGWRHRPYTILVDSQQLESGDAMSAEFKNAAAVEIEDFKQEYQRRYPGRSTDEITDEDLLREVMNTVGKRGQLGEHIRCVISVSMLTEGWDANTVTHILGVRAFGTQLLCEQVVGRALRRMSYAANEDGKFEAEYAEVFGVPFSFIPSNGSVVPPKPGKIPTRVRAMADREHLEVTFPRLTGYRFDIPEGRLRASFGPGSQLVVSTEDVPTDTENAPIIGETSRLGMYDLETKRPNQVAFDLAAHVLDTKLRDNDGNLKPWLFPQVLAITKSWMSGHVTYKDNTFVGMLTLRQYANAAAERIYSAITQDEASVERLRPILRPYDPIGSSRHVDFDTTKPVMTTDPDTCHISHVVADSNWEHKLVQVLEEMDEVVRYVKNEGLGFTIPYTFEGTERGYIPDYIACIDDGRGPDNLLNLIIEVSGEQRKDKAAKVDTARNQWVPAVTNHGGFGRWSFIEIADPWSAESLIRAHITALSQPAVSVGED